MPPPEPMPQPEPGDELRIYIIVRKDAGTWMSKAKFGIQCGHAALMLFTECLKVNPERAWKYIEHSQPKIILQCRDTEQLLDLYQKAFKDGFIAEQVTDLGRTEFGRPTMTAIVVGPVWRDMEADQSFLKRLQLYKEPLTDEERLLGLLEQMPKTEIVIEACEYQNHGAPCCIGKPATTCGHGEWNHIFGTEVLSQAIQWVAEKIKAKSRN